MVLTRRRESAVDDIKIIYNDWPYGIDKSIVHLCVWTKFPLDVDEKDPNGDLTPEMRAKIDEYVNKAFGSRVPAQNVSRLFDLFPAITRPELDEQQGQTD